MDTLAQLQTTLDARKGADADSSYVASLYARGTDHILKKVGEECAEVIVAAKNVAAGEPSKQLIHEVADLWFHSLVLLAHHGLSQADVLNELERRFGTSGHAEKAARGTPGPQEN